MAVLLFGLVSFGLGLVVQLALWRIRRPRRQAKALLVVFAAVPVLLYAALAAAGTCPAARAILPASPAAAAHAALLLVSLTGAWLITYSAVEVDSPSIHIVHAIDRAGEAGIAEADLAALFPDEVLLLPRVADLVTDRMVVLESGSYRLTRKGALLADLFTRFRGLLRLGMGG